MPYYLDRHDLDGATPSQIFEAHQMDLDVQAKHGVRIVTYWFDFERQSGFCLADAPSPEAAEAVHHEAHGLLASEIVEVSLGEVDAYLGRTADPADGADAPIVEAGFRAILFTDIVDSTAIQEVVGDRAAMELVSTHDEVVRGALRSHDGRELQHTGDGLMASFADAVEAGACAVEIQNSIERIEVDELSVRIGINGGEPLERDQRLFGRAVNLARRICDAADGGSTFVSGVIRDLIGTSLDVEDRGPMVFKGFADPVPVYSITRKATSDDHKPTS